MIGFTMRTHLAPIISLFPEYRTLEGIVNKRDREVYMFGDGENHIDEEIPYATISRAISMIFAGKKWSKATFEIFSYRMKEKDTDIFNVKIFSDKDELVSEQNIK